MLRVARAASGQLPRCGAALGQPREAPALRRLLTAAAQPGLISAADVRLRLRAARAGAADADAARLRPHAPRRQLKALLTGPAGARPAVVDLRETEELAAAKLPAAKHFALRCGGRRCEAARSQLGR